MAATLKVSKTCPPRAALSLCLLASGSKGNAVWVQAGKTAVLLDCGISPLQLRRRAGAVEADGAALTAVALSHDHSDHVAGLSTLARGFEGPIHTHQKVARRLRRRVGRERLTALGDGEIVEAGGIEITPIPVPHDAPGTCGFLIECDGRKAAHLTDLGHVPAGLAERLADVALLSIEANHDEDMLALGPYPPALKRRIASKLGHLSNAQCAALVAEVAAYGVLEHVVLAHLSENNNDPDLAHDTVRAALDGCGAEDVELSVSQQWAPTPVFYFR